MYNGPVAEGEEALRAIREFGPPAADFFEPTAYADFQCSIDDPPGYRNWWTAEQLPELSDDAIETVASLAERDARRELAGVHRALGRPVARGAGDGPLAGRDAAFVVHPLLMWNHAARRRRAVRVRAPLPRGVRPYGTGETYPNFIGDEGRERVQGAASATHNAERLAQVKARWDAGNAFHGNHNIRPADGSRAA